MLRANSPGNILQENTAIIRLNLLIHVKNGDFVSCRKAHSLHVQYGDDPVGSAILYQATESPCNVLLRRHKLYDVEKL